tara:strand:- start:307 stop:522 length:216 start_codon:yes stop_codon:yes gene_type:complete
MKKIKTISKIIWSMRNWSFSYIEWRLTTAYPGGWKYAVFHPVELISDLNKYVLWCEKYYKDIKNKDANSQN